MKLKNNITISTFLYILYAILIVFNTKYYSPHDDFLFLSAFEDGNWRGIQLTEFLSGRFNLLHGIDLYLLNKINISNNIPLFYFFISLIFLISIFILHKIIKVDNNILILFSICLLLSVSTTSIYFRLLYQERYVILLFLLIEYILIKQQTTNKKHYIVLIVIFSLLVVLYKEPSILSVFILGLSILIKENVNKENNKNNVYLGFILINISFFIIFIYLLFIYPHITNRYGKNGISFFVNFIKSIIEWSIGDPVLYIIFIPLCLYRIHKIIYKDKITIYDCIAMAGIGYIFTFFILGMAYSQHYLTPVYAFAIPFIVFNKKTIIQHKLFKIFIALTIILQVGNISLGINDIIFQKYNNKNFSSVIQELDYITKSNYTKTKKRTTFFILGGQDQGNHFTFGTLYFMNIKGNTASMFDFISFEKITDSTYSKNVLKNPPYSFMNSNIHKLPTRGDYVLFTPYTIIKQDKYNNTKYKLIKKWSAPTYFGFLNFKDLIRIIARKMKLLENNIRDEHSYKIAEYTLYLKI